MAEISQWTRAIVLCPGAPGQSGISSELAAMMSKRDWFPVEQHDPYLAMAELCLRERAQTARAGWGLQRMEHLAIVVLEPQHWPALEHLIQAVQRYITLATIWVHQDGELVPIGSTTVLSQPVAEAVHASVECAADTQAVPVQNGASTEDSQRISREEIDMLLNLQGDPDSRAQSGNLIK